MSDEELLAHQQEQLTTVKQAIAESKCLSAVLL
jgi:hypothetical protein